MREFRYNKFHVAFRDYNDFIVLYSLVAHKVMVLEKVAADIWRAIACAGASSVDGIVSYLKTKYDVEGSDVANDVSGFIASLIDAGVLNCENVLASIVSGDEGAFDSSWGDGEGRIVAKLKERDQLFTAMFEMTYRCNEKCVHCYVDQTPRTENLSESKCREVLDQLEEMGCLHLMFSGGDPFLHPSFMKIYDYARAKGFVCDIFTNGQYLYDHPEVLQTVIKSLPRAMFISLYGADANTHDTITQIQGSFEKTTAVARKLVSSGIPVVFNVMLMNSNAGQMDEIVALIKDIGADYRVGLSYVYANNGSSAPMRHFVNDKSVLKRVLSMTEKRALSQDGIISEKKRAPEDSLCGACETAICIDPFLDVYPCVSLKIKLGSLLLQKVREVWCGENRLSLVEKLKWKNIPDCHCCHLNNYCQHCASMSVDETGDPIACNACDKLIAESLWESWLEALSEDEIDKEFDKVLMRSLKLGDLRMLTSWLAGCYQFDGSLCLKYVSGLVEKCPDVEPQILAGLSKRIGIDLKPRGT